MISKEGIAELRERLTTICNAAASFFDKAQQQDRGQAYSDIWDDLLTDDLRQEGENLRAAIKRLSIDIAGAARGSPLIAEADFHDIRHSTRRMLASIRFHQYSYRGVYVHHDEDIVLGVDPPSQTEEPVAGGVETARNLFNGAVTRIIDLIDFLSPAETVQPAAAGTETYRPNTAFVMMAIDKNQADLEDIKNSIKDVCNEFGITAITADDIEHEGAITDRILGEIDTNEFLIADLTGERPNVYYEIGHAHARSKRVILYRKAGTKLHFDIAHRNCPEYDNITDLKQQLRKRLETLTNKPRKR